MTYSKTRRPPELACAMILPGASATLWCLAPFLFRDGTLMASERQRAANSRNGRKGGPKTLAQAHWRSLRSRRIETGILNITAAVECIRAREIVEDCLDH